MKVRHVRRFIGIFGKLSCRELESQSAFTLIELMITVAIIGILVSLTTASYTKYQAKARQTEAKISLGAIFSLEKAFYSEYSAYIPSMDAIGFLPEGNRRFYRVGWGGGAWTHSVSTYAGSAGTGIYTELNSPYASCAMGAIGGVTVNGVPFNVNDPQSLIVGAAGRLNNSTGDANCDWWTIDENKRLQNLQIGY